MIARTYVLANLRSLNRLYQEARTQKEALYYSKLALLELCGWIEESMDDVVLRCSVRCIRGVDNRRFVKNTVVKRNYGFEYDTHFRGMLMKVIGLTSVEYVEKRVDPVKHDRLTASLASLKTVRDAEAHTHIKGVARSINAPSLTISHFNAVYDGLVAYDAALRKAGF